MLADFGNGVRNMPYKAEGLARPTVAASLVYGGFECYGLLNEAALRQKNRKLFESIKWGHHAFRRRYDDPTPTTYAGRTPAAELLF